MRYFTLLVALLFAVPAFASEGRRQQPDDNLTNNIATAMTGPIRVDGGNSYAENRANIDRSGNSSSRSDARGGFAENRNTIDLTATGGKGGAGGEASSDNDLTNKQGQAQGQKQAQELVSSNRSGDVTSGDVRLQTVQDTAQANQQRSETAVDVKVEGDKLYIEGDSIVYEDEKDPVNTAATVFASQCSAGASAQTFGMGASLGVTNPMCDLALTLEMALKVGNMELAEEMAMEAARFARSRTNILRRWAQWIPVVGQLF